MKHLNPPKYITNEASQEMPGITTHGTETAINQMKNKRAPSITSEMLKMGDADALKIFFKSLSYRRENTKYLEKCRGNPIQERR